MNDIIDDILRRESSSFTNDPLDRGGATKYGITQGAWDDHVAKDPSRAPAGSVAALTEQMARDFYQAEYIDPLVSITSESLKALMVDSAVQHGLRRAVRWLQLAAGAKDDGIIGKETVFAIGGEFRQDALYGEVLKRRIRFYGEIVTRDPSQLRFLNGWLTRVAEFVR